MERQKHQMSEHKIIKEIPWRDTCFGCNGGPNEGIGMRAYVTEDGYVVGLCHTKACHQGFPDTVHGGIIASYFDEVMWHVTRLEDEEAVAMTVELNVAYKKPVPPGLDVRIVARPVRTEGRHTYAKAWLLLPDDTIAAEGTAHYICVRPENAVSETEPARLLHSQQGAVKSVRF